MTAHGLHPHALAVATALVLGCGGTGQTTGVDSGGMGGGAGATESAASDCPEGYTLCGDSCVDLQESSAWPDRKTRKSGLDEAVGAAGAARW